MNFKGKGLWFKNKLYSLQFWNVLKTLQLPKRHRRIVWRVQQFWCGWLMHSFTHSWPNSFESYRPDDRSISPTLVVAQLICRQDDSVSLLKSWLCSSQPHPTLSSLTVCSWHTFSVSLSTGHGIILSERYSTAAGGKAPLVYCSIQGVFPCISSLSNKRFYFIDVC